MKQYLNLLQEIKDKGTIKPAARAGMPSTLSLFGSQYRCNLSEGFPLLTTKEIKFDHIVTELLWFLRGDTNIKYLVDNECNIWNEDAYNFYLKKVNNYNNENDEKTPIYDFKKFLDIVSNKNSKFYDNYEDVINDYHYGDCGYQYGKLWRSFDGIDQISELIKGLKNNPESRRHMLTALNPAHYNDLALFPCHVVAQFNCRPLTIKERSYLAADAVGGERFANYSFDFMDGLAIPKYYLDCQLYQRSCDVFLGVPYNTASYALLTHILAKICNFEVGDFIHTFGDVHIYENHIEQVDLQLSRIPSELPKLKIDKTEFNYLEAGEDLDNFIIKLNANHFSLENYNPQPAIKAKLSTGLK